MKKDTDKITTIITLTHSRYNEYDIKFAIINLAIKFGEKDPHWSHEATIKDTANNESITFKE